MFVALIVTMSVMTTPLAGMSMQTTNQQTLLCDPIAFINGDGCNPGNDNELDQTEDHLAAYQFATSQEANTEAFLDLYGNYIMDSTDTAWLLAEKVVANEYINGSTKITARSKAVEAVQNYYTIKQLNLINAWNNHAAAIESLRIKNDTLSEKFISYSGVDLTVLNTGSGNNLGQPATTRLHGIEEINVTLINGSTATVKALEFHYNWDKYSTGLYFRAAYGPYIGGNYMNGSFKITEQVDRSIDTFTDPGQLTYRPPNSKSGSLPQSYIWNPDNWNYPIQNTTDANNEVESEIKTWVDNTYSAWDTGQLNASELVSRVNKMENYVVQAQSDNATFNDVVGGLSGLGLSIPTNQTATMNISFEPENINGTLTKNSILMASNSPPTGEWEVNKTYNSNNIQGAEYVYTTNGDTYLINGTFTINSVTNKNGETLTNVNITSPERNYAVTNQSETQDLLTNISEQLNDIQQRQNQVGGGSSPDIVGGVSDVVDNVVGFFANIGQIAMFIVVGLVAILILAIFN